MLASLTKRSCRLRDGRLPCQFGRATGLPDLPVLSSGFRAPDIARVHHALRASYCRHSVASGQRQFWSPRYEPRPAIGRSKWRSDIERCYRGRLYNIQYAAQYNGPDRLASRGKRGGDDGVFQNFSGTLSWAIYSNSGANLPDAELANWQDSSLSPVDIGTLGTKSWEIFRVDAEFSSAITLQPGTYWLVLHEGPWLSSGDGSSVYWADAPGGGFGFRDRFNSNVADPSAGTWQASRHPGFGLTSTVAVPEASAFLCVGLVSAVVAGASYLKCRT